jgi:hypothetical protein
LGAIKLIKSPPHINPSVIAHLQVILVDVVQALGIILVRVADFAEAGLRVRELSDECVAHLVGVGSGVYLTEEDHVFLGDGDDIRIIVVNLVKEYIYEFPAIQTVVPNKVRSPDIIDSLKPALNHRKLAPAGVALLLAVVTLPLNWKDNLLERVDRLTSVRDSSLECTERLWPTVSKPVELVQR